MSIIVCSIPNTGTHLLCEFLDYLALDYIQDHMSDLPYDGDTVVMPIRDPALQFLSYRKRAEADTDFESLLSACVYQWHLLGAIYDRYGAHILRVDRGEREGAADLATIAADLGSDKDPAGFGWPVILPFAGNTPSYLGEFDAWDRKERQRVFTALSVARKQWGYAG